MAVLAGGRAVFDGTTIELAATARGQVWTLDTEGPAPAGNLTVVSAMTTGTGTRYRLVGDAGVNGAQPVEPSVEDGCVAVMRAERAS